MKKPVISDTCFVAPDADIYGNVEIGAKSSVWFHAVIRSEVSPVQIGAETSVQDNCTIHTDPSHEVHIGNRVTIGHGAIVHGCTIGDETLIGMGSIILNGAKIGRHCIVGAGALVTEYKEIPDNSVVVGSPAKVLRQVTEADVKHILENAEAYMKDGQLYRLGEVRAVSSYGSVRR